MSVSKYSKQNPETIQKMFASIAANYDRGNAFLSFNLHRYWNRKLVEKVMESPFSGSLLDLCAGTGDIAAAFYKAAAKKMRPVQVTLLDFCQELLDIAKQKLNFLSPDPFFIYGDAQKLPFEANSFGCATVAYGIRNVAKPKLCIEEVFRVLQPGGTFGILELTRPSNPLIRPFHTLYLKAVVPIIGRLITTDKEAYNYLPESIFRFISPLLLQEYLKNAGFESISSTSLTLGTATIITARKPLSSS